MDKTHRSAETEASIIEAARNIMAEGGYSAVSMRSVAERVGLSATAIYRYFAGKEDLVGRVVRSGYRRFGEYLTEAAEHHPAGSLERLFAMSDAYVRFAFDNQEYFRVLYNIQSRPRDLKDLPGSGGYDLLRSCVVDAMEAKSHRQAGPCGDGAGGRENPGHLDQAGPGLVTLNTGLHLVGRLWS